MTASRFFWSGLIIMGLFALAHLAGFVQAAHAARHDPSLREVTRAMKEHQSSLLGFRPSLLDFRECFSLNFSILLFLGAAIGVVTVKTIRPPDPIIRALSPIYALVMVALFGTSVYYSVVQGMITCGILAVLFGLAWWSS